MPGGLLLEHEPSLRVAGFLAVLAAMLAWERLAPRRRPAHAQRTRWLANLALAACATALVRVLFPAAAVGGALFAEARGWGILRQLDVPVFLALPLSIVLLDLAVYAQHVAFHAVPALWRLHLVHHTDAEFDVTTGIRFHPLEIALSMLWKLAVVVVLGAPAAAVLLFELLLNATSLFNHGNVRIPLGLDRGLRWAVVTPDMHRVHHSQLRRETDSNFGFNLPWWDRLFRTYRAQPEAGHTAMQIGAPDFSGAPRGLAGLLVLPFQREARR